MTPNQLKSIPMKPFQVLRSLLLVFAFSGCSIHKPVASPGADSEIRLNATLVSPTDIRLEWADPTTGAAGHIVEYANNLKDNYVTLGFLPPDQTTFTHPNLMPGTTFYYRVRAFYGPASDPVEVRLPQELSDADYAARFAVAEDYSWATPKTNFTGVTVVKKTIRGADAAAKAGPEDTKATLIPATVSGFLLTWTDRASDEDGYLLEAEPNGGTAFRVCALLAPDVNSFGWALEPPARKASFRVRAFYYGKPSNVVWKTTGARSDLSPPPIQPSHNP